MSGNTTVDVPVTDDDMAEKAWLENRMEDEFNEMNSNTSELEAFKNEGNIVKQNIFNNQVLIDKENAELELNLSKQAQNLTDHAIRLENIQDELAELKSGVNYTLTFTMGGNLNQFFPMAWAITYDAIVRVILSRGSDQNTELFTGDAIPPGVYFDLIQKFDNAATNKVGFFRVNTDRYTGQACVKIPSDKLLSTLTENGNLSTYDYQNTGYSGFWLRGALTYTVATNDPDVMLDLQNCIDKSNESDPIYNWDDNKPQALPPTNFQVPDTSTSGTILLSWLASDSPLASYIVEESKLPDFHTSEIVYTGDDASIELEYMEPGTYHYRVRATKSQYGDSPWVGSTECVVTRTTEIPDTIYVPSTNDDGDLVVSWTTSETPHASYTLEEDTDPLFSDPTQLYIGSDTTHSIVNQLEGVYHYRVKSIRSGYADSDWVEATNSLSVTKNMSPIDGMDIPTTSSGIYIVTWSALSNPTSDIIYTIEEATNVGFTENLISRITADTFANFDHDELELGAFYYRVKASKVGWNDTGWTEGSNACIISKTVEPLSDLVIPTYNETGEFTISWAPSPTENIIYEIQEAIDIDFSNAQSIALQTGLSVELTGKVEGEYYYRVRGIRTNFTSSAWTLGENPCFVRRVVPTPYFTEYPETSESGNYSISWDDMLPGCTYTLQESTSGELSDFNTIFIGTARTYHIEAQDPGEYYYRIKASRDPLNDSDWQAYQAAVNVSRVTLKASNVIVPVNNGTGDYGITWDASETAGVTYELQESTSVDFSTVAVIYVGSNTTTSISDKAPGTYYYRVRTLKSGWVSSYSESVDGCQVIRTTDPAGEISITATGTKIDIDWPNSETSDVTYGVNVVWSGETTGHYYSVSSLTSSILSIDASNWEAGQYTFNVTVDKPGWFSSNTYSAPYTWS